MADLEERFRSLARTTAPDLWEEIGRRRPGPAPRPPVGPRIGAAVVALVLAVTGIGFAGWTLLPREEKPTEPAATVSNGAIAFASGVGGYHIAAVTLDGAVMDITTPAGDAYDLGPVWSPDGAWIAFLRYRITDRDDGTGDYDLFVANADGSGLVVLGRSALAPTWSPDGTSVAFQGFRRETDHDILVAERDGSGERVLVASPLSDTTPRWSPTGELIAFTSHPVLDRDPGDADIFVVRPDGTGLTRLTGSPGWDFEPVWSPDGSRIAYLSEQWDEREAYVMNADGSGVRRLTDAPSNDIAELSWSPDGTRIAFQVFSGTSWDIYLVSADGTEQVPLVTSPLDEVDPTWSPDGTLVAYSAAGSVQSCRCDNAGTFDVYVVTPDTSSTTRLTVDAGVLGGGLSWRSTPFIAEATSPPRTPSGAEIVGTFEVGDDVRSVAYGDGSVWVAVSNNDGTFGGRILRIDPATHEIQAEIPVEVIPTWDIGGGAMVVHGGSLWVTGAVDRPGNFEDPGGGADAAVIRIDTASNALVQTLEIGGNVGADLTFLGDELWVLLFGDETIDHRMEIVRVDPYSGEALARVPLSAKWGHTIVASEGRLVLYEPGEGAVNVDGSLVTVDPSTREVLRVATPSKYFEGGPVAWRDQVWFAAERGFARFDPVTGEVIEGSAELDPSRFAFCCGFIEAGERGIWFVGFDPRTEGSERRLDLFDPATGTVIELVALGGKGTTPVAMAVAPDAVWILNSEGTLTHVALT